MGNINKKIKDLIKKLQYKYRLSIYNDSTFDEVYFIRLSRLNIIAYGGLFAVICGIITFLLTIYGPLSVFVPDTVGDKYRDQIFSTFVKLDSLEKEIETRDLYLHNLKALLEGKQPDSHQTIVSDSTIRYDTIDISQSEVEENFKAEYGDALSKKASFNKVSTGALSDIHFVAPLNKGLITNKFDRKEAHFGIDIVGAPNSGVFAIEEGTVTMASWTLETGYVIGIQHDDNLVSYYKHNSALLKKAGTTVKAGEIIAIIGNSGELSTGPHLHFELWHNGSPIDPEKYIVF